MTTRPNFLIFMTDQQRGSAVLPGSAVKMPVIERFREQSVTFSRAYAPSPHCCPSRATFFTGLYPSQHGVWNNVCVQNALATDLRAGVRLWSEDLADAGYRLDWNGKWHVSWERGPDDFGFTVGTITAGARRQGYGVMGPTWDTYRSHREQSGARRPGEILRPGWGNYRHYGIDPNPFHDADHVDAAIGTIIGRNQDAPWCHFIGPVGPHDPYFVPQEFLDLYDPAEIELPASFRDAMQDKPALYRRMREVFDQLGEDEHREAIRHYLAFCSYEDHLFGRALQALEESGQADNTVVIYVSDHGDYFADHGLWCKGLPAFEGAYHVPMIIRAPPGGTAPLGRIEDAFVSLADFAPTILDMAGVGGGRDFTGESLAPFLSGKRPTVWRDAVFTQTNGNELYGIQRSVRTQEWKLVYNGFDHDELYHLASDPHEMRNLARDPELRGIRQELYRRLWKFAERTGDVAINNYIMVGLAEFGPGIIASDRWGETPSIG